MRFSIEKVSVYDLNYADFVSIYLLPEKPVVVTDVPTLDPTRLSPEYIKARFQHETGRQIGWFESALIDDGDIRLPSLVRQVLDRRDMKVRTTPMRLFMQPVGHITLPHYDGNSLHGFNLQVLGKKRWIITSSDTPLPTIPFAIVAMTADSFKYDPRNYNFADFVTKPGDMLFLPRYWFHEVHTLCDVNLNVNWVFTPSIPNKSALTGKRETELLKIKRSWPFVSKCLFPDPLDDYGGQGDALLQDYSAGVGIKRMIGRILIELSGYPRYFLLRGQIKRRLEEFSSNNFNV